MNNKELYQYKKGQLSIIEKLNGKSFTPCRQSDRLKNYLNSKLIELEDDISMLESKLNIE